MTLYEGFQAFAEERGFPYECTMGLEDGAPTPGFFYEGENGRFAGHVLCAEHERMLVAFADLNIRVKPEKMQEAALLLAQLNYHIKIGGLHLDTASGAIMVRLAQFVPDSEAAQKELIERVILGCGFLADEYYLELLRQLVV